MSPGTADLKGWESTFKWENISSVYIPAWGKLKDALPDVNYNVNYTWYFVKWGESEKKVILDVTVEAKWWLTNSMFLSTFCKRRQTRMLFLCNMEETN